MGRSYTADLPGGTATTTVQIQATATLKRILLTYFAAAAGKVEVSLSPASQIATAQPTSDVIARFGAGVTNQVVAIGTEINVPVKAFQSIYIHQTGTGNLGTINLF